MRRSFLLLFFLFAALHLGAQGQSETGDGNTTTMTSLQGLLRAQLTITPAFSLAAKANDQSVSYHSGDRTNIYLHGTLEYYFNQRFSMRGDGYYFVNKDKRDGGLLMNHSAQIGFSWHLLKKNITFDPFIGARGGWSFVKTNPVYVKGKNDSLSTRIEPNMEITPIWAPHIGINFFGQHIFHFFIEAQYLFGTYRPNMAPSLSINELRISAGLGWNWVFVHKEAEIRQGI